MLIYMLHLRKNQPSGDHAGDNTGTSLRETASPADIPADGAARSGYRMHVILLLGVAILVFMAAIKWTDVVEWIDGEWRLKSKREAERDKQMRETEDVRPLMLKLAAEKLGIPMPAEKVAAEG